MKFLFIVAGIIVFIFSYLLATPQSEMTISGGKVTISAGYLDFGVSELDKVVVSTTTGQCIGVLCGVTHAN